jgi:hypothetical protein
MLYVGIAIPANECGITLPKLLGNKSFLPDTGHPYVGVRDEITVYVYRRRPQLPGVHLGNCP